MKSLFSTKAFWISALLLSGGCIYFTFYFFSSAFSIVNIDLRVDRTQALAQAAELDKQYGWGPAHFQQALQFETDSAVKTFVELEAGGVPALTHMIEQDLYSPYTWNIRHFKEFDTHEVLIRLKPDGTPYGFLETLSENAPGEHLPPQAARDLAEDAARAWHVNLHNFKLIDSAQEVRPSGRADHAFTYERPNMAIGAGRYRLRLVVSGNKLTELTHFIKIPEEFILRYREIRSSNEGLASAATMLMMLLYLMGGCIIGLAILAHQRWILWKTALVWALVVAFLELLATFNQLPLLWLYYDTALPANSFLINIIVSSFYACVTTILYMTITFVAAESLTRKAFGHHLQLWRTWSPRFASSLPVIGQTVSGYVLTAFDLAFGVGFYLVATKCFGWWVPSDTLVNPNILATYFPWLSPISQAFKAGFYEECLFRAIPLASAALLGSRFGGRRWWIGGAFILQALIFGAAHANYATQPAYARLVELVFPSCVWGAVYLAFGLLPIIISHVLVDIVWMALPIFVGCGNQALMNQIMVVVCGLLPLGILLWAYLKKRTLTDITADDYNGAWKPKESEPFFTPEAPHVHAPTNFPVRAQRIAAFTALVCVLSWFLTTDFSADAPTVYTSRAQAEKSALNALPSLTRADWTILSTPHSSFSNQAEELMQHKFIWQTGGQQTYRNLLQHAYLLPPLWIVRFVKFSGSITDRAQEYQVLVGPNNEIIRTTHTLAETAPGAHLTEPQARELAHRHLLETYRLDATVLKEISATSDERPARKDWVFIFSNKAGHPTPQGDARIKVIVGGDQVTTSYPYVFVPEEWTRKERHHQNTLAIAATLCNLFAYVGFLIALFILLRSLTTVVWRRGLVLLLGFALLFAIATLNTLPDFIASFNTSEPYSHQLLVLLGSLGIGLLIKASLFALIALILLKRHSFYSLASTHQVFLLGISAGTFLAALQSLLWLIEPNLQPLWGNYAPLNTALPILGALTAYLTYFMYVSSVFALFYCVVHQLSLLYPRYATLAAGTVFIGGEILFAGFQGMESVWFWLLLGSVMGAGILIAYYAVLRLDYGTVPITVATFTTFSMLRSMILYPFPAIIPGGILALGALWLLAYYWMKTIRRT